jgi:hypothetical protein
MELCFYDYVICFYFENHNKQTHAITLCAQKDVRNSVKVLAVKPDGEELLDWLQVNVMLLKLALGRWLDTK